MEPRLRLLSAACAVVLLAGVVSAFRVADGDENVASQTDETADAASTRDVDADSSSTSATSTSAPEDASSTTGAPSTETNPEDTTPTTPGPTTPETTTPPTTVPIGVTATEPGTYVYDVSGTVDGAPISGSSQLTVTEPDASGRQTQTQAGPEGRSSTVYRFTPEGTYLESMTMDAQGQSLTLKPQQAFLVIPAGAEPGTVREGRLTGSGLTADVTFTLADVTADTAKARIEADIRGSMVGCDVRGSMTTTITARRTDQLPLTSVGKTDFRVKPCLVIPAGMDMSSDVETTLRR